MKTRKGSARVSAEASLSIESTLSSHPSGRHVAVGRQVSAGRATRGGFEADSGLCAAIRASPSSCCLQRMERLWQPPCGSRGPRGRCEGRRGRGRRGGSAPQGLSLLHECASYTEQSLKGAINARSNHVKGSPSEAIWRQVQLQKVALRHHRSERREAIHRYKVSEVRCW